MADNVGGIDSPAEISAGAAPVDANQRQSRPASANKGAHLSLQLETTTADNGSTEPGSRDGGANSALGRERDDRARLVRERNQGERQRKLEELRAQALAAQRFREQKEDERRRRIDEMRLRDNDRRTQVEERKRAIWEAERERREAILRRNSERDARLEVRKRGGTAAAAVFAFGSSTPRMLEPADTGGTFWGHRRATSTSNVMFAALPLSRRSSERELDPNKKRATSASGLDRQPGDEDGNATDSSSWSRGVARRRTDLVPTLPAGHRVASAAVGTPRSPGRAYSMTRLDQLARPRKIIPFTMPTHIVQPSAPSRPPRHRSAGNLAGMSKAHRSMGNLTQGATVGHNAPSPPPRKHSRPPHVSSAAASHHLNAPAVSGLRSGEVTPGSPSRPGSSLSSASVNNSAMTSSVAGALSVNRRPRATPRRPRPASIAGTGVTTPPHVKNNAVGIDGKPIGVRAEKPPLPRVHSAATGAKKTTQPPTPTSDKPEVPRRTHKGGSVKASPRATPRATPLQSPGNDFPPFNLEEIQESTTVQTIKEGGEVTESQTHQTVTETSTSESSNEQDVITTITTETVKQVTKDEDGEKETETKTVTTSVVNNGPEQVSAVVTETVTISGDEGVISKTVETSEKIIEKNEPKNTNGSEPTIVEAMKNMKVKEETVEVPAKEEVKVQDTPQTSDPLEGADMTGSMMARSRGMITTEEGAKAALAERRKFAREEAERQAERERLRLEREEEEEAERQRQEDERQRRLEEETLRLSELQRQAEEERLQQAILEAQRRTEEENQRREAEIKAKAERDIAEVRAREEAERQRRDTAQRLRREEEEREARRKRVEAIMLRTRQAKQKKDGDKSPTEENKSLEDVEQKLEAKLNEEEAMQRQSTEVSEKVDIESSYELSVRQREEDLLNHTAPHNQAGPVLSQPQPPQSFSPKPAEVEIVTGNGLNSFQNGTSMSSSNGDLPKKDDAELSQSNNSYAVQNGHSKNQINELNNFINTSENQFNSVALDNAVKQNNVTNNLLDISDLDLLNTANSNNPFLIDVNTNGGSQMQPLISQQNDGNSTNQIIDLSVETITKSLINEDSVNSNQTNNSPFITSFQDNQENRDVSLL